MAQEWTRVDRDVPYRDPRMTVYVDRIENDNGIQSTYTLVDFSDAVFVIAEAPDARIALIKQFRYPLASWQHEIIAGGLPKGTGVEEQARREVFEETHLTTAEVDIIGRFAMQPNRSVNYGYVVLAHLNNTDQADVLMQEPDECIREVGFFTREQVIDMIEHGEINGAYCLAALSIYLLKNII